MKNQPRHPWDGWQPPAPMAGETPLGGAALRARLSPTGNPKKPLGSTTFSALNQAMGCQRNRRGFLSHYVAFIAQFPGFRATAIYGKPRGAVLPARKFKVGGLETFYRGRQPFRFRITALTPDGKPKTLEAAE